VAATAPEPGHPAEIAATLKLTSVPDETLKAKTFDLP
jgi:hypothetical protein